MDPLEHIINFLKTTDELKAGSDLLKVFKKYSTSVEQYDQLGKLFNDVKDYYEALDCAETTLVLAKDPNQLYKVRCNLAKMYNAINQPQKALNYINANLSLGINNPEMLMEKLFSLYLAGDMQESQKITEDLVNDPNTPKEVLEKAKFNLGTYLLDENKFQQGLNYFIGVGHDIGIWPKTQLPGKPWDGSTIPDATIAILAEGGIGDEIINIRFMKHIKDLGMNPIFITNRDSTLELFNKNNLPTVRSIAEVPKDAHWILSMYLPIALNLQPKDLWHGPYLQADPIYVEKWKNILPPNKKVAIRWKGNPYYDQDLHRSIPLSDLDDILNFSRTDVTFVSVQKDNYEGIEDYPTILNVADQLETLDDLLACLSLCDDIISSCTSVAHVAAAANLPITVCPPIATYYVWLGDSKWYDSNCKILRQTKWKDWSHLKQIKV